MFQGLNQVTSLAVNTGSGGITALPSIVEMIQLVTLDLSYNNLSALPDTFQYLTSLATVRVGVNAYLVKLSPSMKCCTSLASLTTSSTTFLPSTSLFYPLVHWEYTGKHGHLSLSKELPHTGTMKFKRVDHK